jgi:hypothetical protein
MAHNPRIQPLPPEPHPAQGLNLSGSGCAPDALMTTAQCAAYLNCSPLSLNDWRCKKIGPPYVRAQGCIRYLLSAVQAWIAANTVETGD